MRSIGTLKRLIIKNVAFAVFVMMVAAIAPTSAFGQTSSGSAKSARKQEPAKRLTLKEIDKQLRVSSQPYIVLDPTHQEISIRMGGVTMLECTAVTLNDSGQTAEFVDEWASEDSLIQTVTQVHLLSAAKTLTKIELEAIMEVSGLSEEQTQRYVPTKMLIETSAGYRIEIESEGEGEMMSTVQSVRETFRGIWRGIWGAETLKLRLSGPDAMSLYGAAQAGPKIVLLQE